MMIYLRTIRQARTPDSLICPGLEFLNRRKAYQITFQSTLQIILRILTVKMGLKRKINQTKIQMQQKIFQITLQIISIR